MARTWSKPQAVGARYADHVRVSEVACTTGSEDLGYQGAYAGGTIYAKGALVTFGGVLYVSLQDGNQARQPDQSQAWWSPEVGLDLKNLAAVGVHVELAGVAVIPNGAVIQFWLVNPATGVPNRAQSLDQPLASAGAGGEGIAGFVVPPSIGRLLALPLGVGAACNLFLNGVPQPGILQS